MAPSAPYPYPVGNSELIKKHGLETHFEGGYFKQTIALASESASTDGSRAQHASGSGTDLLDAGRIAPEQIPSLNDATCIYYLISPRSSRGRMHMNDYATFHLHHAGRALYTLIAPPTGDGAAPVVHRIVMGSDLSAGEVTQLFVPGGWWKASEIPDEDLLLLDAPEAADLREHIGCLISEVVVPGWTIEQHQFLTEDKLKALWAGKDGWQAYKPYLSGPAQSEQ